MTGLINVLLMSFLLLWNSATGDVSKIMVVTWSRLNWKQIIILDSETSAKHLPLVLKQAGQAGISITNVDTMSFLKDFNKDDCSSEFCEVLFHEQYITYMDNLKYKSSETIKAVSILAKNLNPHHVLLVTSRSDQIIEAMKRINHLMGLYMLDLQTDSVYRLLTLTDQDAVVQNKLEMQHFSTFYDIEKYDMQGTDLASVTCPYSVYLGMENCDPQGLDCDISGILAESIELIGQFFNFTGRVHFHEDWGAVPAYGSYGEGNAVFIGAMGSVINYTCDFGLSLWVPTADRAAYMEFSMGVLTQWVVTGINRALPRMDVTLFLRPFTPICWILIAVTIVVVSLCILVPPWHDKASSQSELGSILSYRIVIISSWVFFILVNAFYSGALTMFFSSPPNPPFTSAREGLLMYPKWKMTLPAGQLILTDYLAKEIKDPPYVEFYDRAERPRQTEILPMPEALGMLKKESHFVYSIKQPMLAEFDRTKPSGVDLQLVTKEYGFAGSLIFGKRSPLSKMFNKGIQRLRQTGTLDVIKNKWEIARETGSKDSNGASFTVEALAGRQTSLVFLVYGFVSVATAIVLMMECCWAKIVGKRNKYKRSSQDFTSTYSKSWMKRRNLESAKTVIFQS